MTLEYIPWPFYVTCFTSMSVHHESRSTSSFAMSPHCGYQNLKMLSVTAEFVESEAGGDVPTHSRKGLARKRPSCFSATTILSHSHSPPPFLRQRVHDRPSEY